MSRWIEHVETWKDCTRCRLHEGRSQVVLARGTVPCGVLLIGEAPGESEDVLGRPFVGPAGKLIDQIVERAIPAGVSHAFTNLLACIPRDDNGKMEIPPVECVRACAPRLTDFVEIANPKLIVTVGTEARDWLDPKQRKGVKLKREIPMIDIVHPAYILRVNVAQQDIAVRRCIVTIANAVREYVKC